MAPYEFVLSRHCGCGSKIYCYMYVGMAYCIVFLSYWKCAVLQGREFQRLIVVVYEGTISHTTQREQILKTQLRTHACRFNWFCFVFGRCTIAPFSVTRRRSLWVSSQRTHKGSPHPNQPTSSYSHLFI